MREGGKCKLAGKGSLCGSSSGGHRGSIAMVPVGLTHASFQRLASEPNGTVMTPGRSDAFPYRFQEVAVATTTSTYTCIISSQPRSMAAQDIDCFFFLEIYNMTSGEDYQSQVHHVSQTPSTHVGRTSYRICRLHSHSSATHNTSPSYLPLALFSRQAHISPIVEEEVSQDKPPSARDEKRTEEFMKRFGGFH